MDVNGKIQELMDKAQARVDAAQKEVDDAQAEVDALIEMAKQIGTDLADGKKAEYERGYAEGKASIVLPDPAGEDKIYSQAEVNDIVNKAEAKKDADAKAEADKVATEHADEVKELKDALVESEGAVAERDQLLAGNADDLAQIADARKELDARLDKLGADIG